MLITSYFQKKNLNVVFSNNFNIWPLLNFEFLGEYLTIIYILLSGTQTLKDLNFKILKYFIGFINNFYLSV